MAIFIGQRPKDQFTRVPNAWARDPKLSTKAKGLLLYLLSHQDGYRLTVQQVIAENTDGRDSIYKTLAELGDRGYLRRDQRRGVRGKVGEVDYYVVDAPGQTASGFTASGEPGSGGDLPECDEAAGQTASWFTGYGSAASGKSATKKTRVKKTKVLEDKKKTTSPNPSTDVALAEVVDAEIVEEGEDSTPFLEHQIQDLIDEAVALKPNWRKLRSEIRQQIDASMRSFGNLEAVSVIVRETAKDPKSAHPSRITASGNPAVIAADLALTVTHLNETPGGGRALHPDSHRFERSAESPRDCRRCPFPELNDRHRVGNQAGGYVTQLGRMNGPGGNAGTADAEAGAKLLKGRSGSTYHFLTDSHHPDRDYTERL